LAALHARLQASQDEMDQLRLQLQSSVHENMEKTLQLGKLRTRYTKAMHGLKGVQNTLCSQLDAIDLHLQREFAHRSSILAKELPRRRDDSVRKLLSASRFKLAECLQQAADTGSDECDTGKGGERGGGAAAVAAGHDESSPGRAGGAMDVGRGVQDGAGPYLSYGAGGHLRQASPSSDDHPAPACASSSLAGHIPLLPTHTPRAP